MQIPTFSQPSFLHIWLRRSGPAVLLISLSGPWISVFSPTNPPHTNLHIGPQAVPSGMKTRRGSPSNWASERSGCLFIWQRTWLAKTYCLNPSFPRSYYIIILISCPNWNQQKHNPTPFLSFSPPLKGKVRRVCVCCRAARVEGMRFGEVSGIVSLFICILPSAFLFNTSDETDTRCLRARGTAECWAHLTSSVQLSAAWHTLLSVGVWIWATTEGISTHRMIHSLTAAFLLSNCSGRVRILQYFGVFCCVLFFLFFLARRIERVLVFEAFAITNVKEEQRRQTPTENWLNSPAGHNFMELIWLSAFHYAFITISNCFSQQYFILLRAVLLLLFIFGFLPHCFVSMNCLLLLFMCNSSFKNVFLYTSDVFPL